MSKHKFLGRISVHHLVPRFRIKTFYGTSFHMPNNTIRLWRLRHDAWHVLFDNKSLNEVIRYLNKKKENIYGYMGPAWKLLFREKTAKQARFLLIYARKRIRKRYAYLEFEQNLKIKIVKMYKKSGNKIHHEKYLSIIFSKKRRA